MGGAKRVLAALWLALGLAWAPGTAAGEWLDLRVDWLTDYSGLLDEADFSYLGYLRLHKQAPGLLGDFGAEAAVDLYLHHDSFADNGSFVRLFYDLSGGRAERRSLSLIFYPLDANRFWLGGWYPVAWGFDDFYPARSDFVPGGRLQLELGWLHAFFGYKATRLPELDPEHSDYDMAINRGLLAGLGVELAGFSAEVSGGTFNRGTFQNTLLRGRGVYASGLSYQVGYASGAPVGRQLDFELYRDHPDLPGIAFGPEEPAAGLSFSLAHQGSLFWQTLADADEPGQTHDRLCWAFGLNAALRLDGFRFYLDGLARSLSFLQRSAPGLIPYQDFPEGAEVAPELWLMAGADYTFSSLHLTPGLRLGLKRPASYSNYDLLGGRRTMVIGGTSASNGDILPAGEGAVPIYTLQASLRWDLAGMLALVAELHYAYDNNQVVYRNTSGGLNEAEFADPNLLRFTLMAQAVF